MTYVFDTSSLIDLFRHYYPNRFPSLWEKFNKLIPDNKILLVREVYNEIMEFHKKDRLAEWAKDNRHLFSQPSDEEMGFISQIFSVNHFQALIGKKEMLTGKPVADPMLVAKAKIENACLVTQESHKENAAKIPNVCEHFDIPCIDLEGFMEREGWEF